jgi:hypothetical protein
MASVSDLSAADVAQILRASEGRQSRFQEKSGPGHAYSRHVALTNAALGDRVAGARDGSIALFTAFSSPADQIEAARETLNSVEGKWAREQFFDAAGNARFPQGAHTGMRATIHHSGQPRRVRYAGGGGIAIFSDYVMALERDDSCFAGLFVKTFYATIREATPRFRVTIFGRSGQLFAEGP